MDASDLGSQGQGSRSQYRHWLTVLDVCTASSLEFLIMCNFSLDEVYIHLQPSRRSDEDLNPSVRNFGMADGSSVSLPTSDRISVFHCSDDLNWRKNGKIKFVRLLWQLRTSLGKALMRKKDTSSASSSTSSSMLSAGVTHATSLPSIPQPQSSTYHDQHIQQSVNSRLHR